MNNLIQGKTQARHAGLTYRRGEILQRFEYAPYEIKVRKHNKFEGRKTKRKEFIMSIKSKKVFFLVGLCVLSGIGSILIVMGCASIIHGTKQDVSISSTPGDANITVDGTSRGKTPFVVELSRKNKHVIKLELNGYETYEMNLTRKVSGWYWGNILFGGIVGFIVDPITGGMYKIKPEQITAVLAKSHVSLGSQKDALYIAVQLKRDPSWKKIGDLKKNRRV